MRQEILMLKARIAEEKKRLSHLELTAQGLLTELRLILDPYADLLSEVDMEQARAVFEELYYRWKEAREVREKLSRMERDLGNLKDF